MTYSPGARAHHPEINRLRAIIAAQDARILRMQQQHAEHNERMEAAMANWRRSMDDLIREVQR